MKEYPHMYVQHLSERLDEAVGPELRRQILAGAEALTSKTSKPARARILKTVMERMEQLMDRETAIRVRASCACKPPSFLKKAKEIYAASPDIPTFLSEMEKQRTLGWPLRLEGDRIVGEFGYRACVCAKVNGSKEPLPMLWCECCKGHVIWMYENVFGRPVKVEMSESVITGGEECRYTVDLA
jgi:hypothetical protein